MGEDGDQDVIERLCNKDEKIIEFRKKLEAAKEKALDKENKMTDKEKKIAQSEIVSWEEEIEEKRKKIKKRRYGNITFIGHLFERDLLIEKVVHDYCIKALLRTPTDENMESLFHLLVQVGKKIEDKAQAALKKAQGQNMKKPGQKGKAPEPQKNIIQSYFDRIRKLMDNKSNGLSQRSR